MGYSIGIGITNRCNYKCSHCYSREHDKKEIDLTLKDIKYLCHNLDIQAVNLGTGESILHPQFFHLRDNQSHLNLDDHKIHPKKLLQNQ